MKPPLTYYGGKQRLAQYILSLIPKHTLYCEPFFGGGAIFFAKEPSEIEVINDSNGDLINFYRVMKNNFASLKREVRATLHSREHHQSAKMVLGYPQLFNEIKRAWAIWVLANESYSSRLDASWGFDRKRNTSAKRLHHKREKFPSYEKRLELTEIENADALSVIESRDGKNSFFYCDPPYFNAHKGHFHFYSEQDFEDLLKCLSSIKGKFLLSSYPSPLLEKYKRKYKWHSKAIEMPLAVTARYKRQQTKTEVLTANYPL
jgi:DNA adenine methylase